VDVRQSLHFTQVFKILKIFGYEKAGKCDHIAYELVTCRAMWWSPPGKARLS
jgi:arginyl-tRNA synthetase